MDTIIIAIHVVTCLVLILVILLQSGKGADMGAAFGGAGSTVFGPSSGGNALTKITTGAAITFMCTSLALALLSARQTSIFDDVVDPLDAPAAVSAPAEGAADNANASPTASDFAVPPPAAPDGGAAAIDETAPGAVANEVAEAAGEAAAEAANTVGQAAGAGALEAGQQAADKAAQ